MTNYTTNQGDTWDVISLKSYDSELFASELIAANYAHRNTAIFSAGVQLNVPDISTQTITNTNLPPWRR